MGLQDKLHIWEFPKIRGTLFWGPYNKDPTIWGTIFGSPIFGSSHFEAVLANCSKNPQAEASRNVRFFCSPVAL